MRKIKTNKQTKVIERHIRKKDRRNKTLKQEMHKGNEERTRRNKQGRTYTK
jgi:hypothetical protein